MEGMGQEECQAPGLYYGPRVLIDWTGKQSNAEGKDTFGIGRHGDQGRHSRAVIKTKIT